jgi:hypothetical protein
MVITFGPLPDNDDPALLRTSLSFLYASLFFDLVVAFSSLYIQGALPVLARRKAMAIGAPKSAPSVQIHEPDHVVPQGRLNGRHCVQVLERYGINRLWRYVAYNMLSNLVLGYICFVTSIIICVWESPALVILAVVIAAGSAVSGYRLLRSVVSRDASCVW